MPAKWYRDPTNHLNLFRESRQPGQRAVALCQEHAMEHGSWLELHRNIKTNHECMLCFLEDGPEIRTVLLEYAKTTNISFGPNYNPFFLIASLIADLLFYARMHAQIRPVALVEDVWKQYTAMINKQRQAEEEYHVQRAG